MTSSQQVHGQKTHGQVLQKSSYKTKKPCFTRLVLEKWGAISIFNRLTEDERRKRKRAKAHNKQTGQRWQVKDLKIKKDTLKVRHEGGVVSRASGLLIQVVSAVTQLS